MDSENLPAKIERRITELAIADAYVIATASEAVAANATLGELKTLAGEVDAAQRAEIAPLNAAIAAVRDRFRPAAALLSKAERTVKTALIVFQTAETKRLAQERARQAAEAAKEQARLLEEAERERERASVKAKELEAQGRSERAAAVLTSAEESAAAKRAIADVIPAAVAAPQATELEGFSTRRSWKGRVTNSREFLDWLATQEGLDVDALVTWRDAGLNTLAMIYKDERKIPGFAAAEVTSAVRR